MSAAPQVVFRRSTSTTYNPNARVGQMLQTTTDGVSGVQTVVMAKLVDGKTVQLTRSRNMRNQNGEDDIARVVRYDDGRTLDDGESDDAFEERWMNAVRRAPQFATVAANAQQLRDRGMQPGRIAGGGY